LYRIGILQLTQFLDDAVRGFKSGLVACGIEAAFEYHNADGNANHLPALASEFETTGVDLIFACSTPSAQAATSLTNIPVIFTPVFDPVGAGLALSLKEPGGKATGMAGMVSPNAKLDFIETLLPQVKNIGVLYHRKDSNSLLEVSNFKAAAKGRYTLTEIAFDHSEALSTLGEQLSPLIDVLFVPIGKEIEENFATVSYYADLSSLPIIASNAANVPAGALGALVADHFKLGFACAAQADKILRGANPGSIPIVGVDKPDILLNNYVADNLGILFPPDLVANAREIFD
jgi:putative ABC transport system substrate-binding protein